MTVTEEHMDVEVFALTISIPVEVIVAPGTVAVITVPPIDPEFGVTEAN
jgi:hypothetical protein